MRRDTKFSRSIERDRISPDRQYGRGSHALKGDANKIQLHHLITNGMVSALEDIGFAGARALRNRKALQYLSAPGQHVGYEGWHIAMDKAMTGFIRMNADNLTESKLLQFVHDYYQSPAMKKRIPGVDISR